MVSASLVGAAATFVTIFMFLCPASTIIKIYKNKDVPADFNVYPYSFTAVLATLWWYYGAIVEVCYNVTPMLTSNDLLIILG